MLRPRATTTDLHFIGVQAHKARDLDLFARLGVEDLVAAAHRALNTHAPPPRVVPALTHDITTA